MDTLTARHLAAGPHRPRLGPALVRELMALYGVGEAGTATPLAGRDRWRLGTGTGAFLVERAAGAGDEHRARLDADLITAVGAAGVAAAPPLRTVEGDVVGRTRIGPVVLRRWVDLVPATDVTPVELGDLMARLHRVGRADRRALEWWFAEPVRADRWDEIVVALDRADAPFAPVLAARRDELVALGAVVGRARMVQTCHREVGPDTLRRGPDGALWLVGWGCVGPADPGHELAAVLLRTAGGDPARARAVANAYRAAGGHGVVDGPASFSMVVTEHAHALEVACRRWLASSATETDRRREADRVQALLAGPVRVGTVEAIAAAVAA